MAVSIPIVSEFDSKGISKAINEFKSLEGAGAKAQFALSKAALPAAAAIGGLAIVVGDATKAAMEDAKAQALLAQAIEKNTLAGTANVKAAEAYIEKTMMSAAVADDQLRPALATLVQTTGDLTYSQDLLNSALDISAATGADLGAVTDAVAKAYSGNTKALASLIPSLRGTIKEGASLDEIMRQVNATVGGAAVVAANSAEGQMKKLSLTFAETKESIGAAFLPILERLLPTLQRFASFVQANTDLVVGMIAVIGGLASTILVLNTAIKVATAAQTVFNLVMAANPVVAATIAIAALVAGLVILEEKTGQVTATWARFGSAIRAVLGPVYDLVAGLMAIAKFAGFDIKLPSIDSLTSKINVPTPATVTGTSGPDLLERKYLTPTIPTIPAVVIPPTSGGGGGGGGGGLSIPKGIVNILPIDEGFIGGGGGGFGAAPGNEALLDGLTGGVTVIVNAAIAEASIGQTIVDALTEYNRSSGPLQLEIA